MLLQDYYRQIIWLHGHASRATVSLYRCGQRVLELVKPSPHTSCIPFIVLPRLSIRNSYRPGTEESTTIGIGAATNPSPSRNTIPLISLARSKVPNRLVSIRKDSNSTQSPSNDEIRITSFRNLPIGTKSGETG
jgi:hypothetical protein